MAQEILTKEDLEKFKLDLLRCIERLMDVKSGDHPEWLRSAQVRKMLNISPNTLQQLRINGNIKCTKMGGIFFYNRKELEQMMEGKNGG